MKYKYFLTDEGIIIINKIINNNDNDNDYTIRYDGEIIWNDYLIYNKKKKYICCTNEIFNNIFTLEEGKYIIKKRKSCNKKNYKKLMLYTKKTKVISIIKPIIGLTIIAIGGYGLWKMKI